MATLISIYEQEYIIARWFDREMRRTSDADSLAVSWFDRELTTNAKPADVPKPLAQIFPPFFDDPDDIKLLDGGPGKPLPGYPDITPTSGIWVVVFPGLFLDDDLFFIPMSLRILATPDQMLKNEVRRIR